MEPSLNVVALLQFILVYLYLNLSFLLTQNTSANFEKSVVYH